MKCLAVNTATTVLSVALTDGDRVLHLFETPETRDQGNLLLKHIGVALRENGLSYADIERFAVVTGPGSFTGIRIGLSAMRALGLATGKPVVGVDSFDMFAVRRAKAPNLVAVESWREELYFRLDDLYVNETPEAFAKRPEARGPLVVSGDAAAKVLPLLPHAVLAEGMGNAVDVARIAIRVTDITDKAVPFYLREADVTVKKG